MLVCLHQNQRHKIYRSVGIARVYLCVSVYVFTETSVWQIKWNDEKFNIQEKKKNNGKTEMEKSERTMRTIHERWNVVKHNIRWDAREKNWKTGEKSSKYHYSRKYCSFFLRYAANRYKNTIYKYTYYNILNFKICSTMCVVCSFISVKSNTLSSTSGSSVDGLTYTYIYKTYIEWNWKR